MRYSKFFFDRPSGQGFRKGLGINPVKPILGNDRGMDMDTAFQIPEFKNQDEVYMLARDGRPWYFSPYFHSGLICCAMAYISFLFVLWGLPGTTFAG